MSNARRFGTVTYESMTEHEAAQKPRANSSLILPENCTWLKLPKDKNFIKIDVLPFITHDSNGETVLARFNYWIHRNVGPGFQSFICPTKQNGEPCPICDYIRKYDWNNPSEQTIIRKYKAQQRQLYAVRWIDAPEAEDRNKIFIFDVSEFGFGRIIDEKIKGRDTTDPYEAVWTNYADLLEGLTLKVNLCEKTWSGNTYPAVSSVDFKTRQEKYDESWYDKVPDLAKMPVIVSYAEMREKFHPDEAPTVASAVASAVNAYDPTAGYNPMVDTTSSPSSAATDDIPF